MFCLKLRTKPGRAYFCWCFCNEIRLFRMSWKARGNVRCIFNIIFVYLACNSVKRIHHSIYCWSLGEDIRTSESESECSEHSSDTIDMNLCHEKDMRFIRTCSWVFKGKEELFNFAIWKIKSNAMFSLGALHRSAMCTFISRQRKIASRNDISYSSIENISKCSKV